MTIDIDDEEAGGGPRNTSFNNFSPEEQRSLRKKAIDNHIKPPTTCEDTAMAAAEAGPGFPEDLDGDVEL